MSFEIIKIIFLLLLVLGLMYGTFYLVRKYLFVYDNDAAKYKVNIKVLSTKMLMPKKFIQVVQVHDKILVLGISDHSINVLYEFEGDAEEFKANQLEKIENRENFSELLKRNLGIK